MHDVPYTARNTAHRTRYDTMHILTRYHRCAEDFRYQIDLLESQRLVKYLKAFPILEKLARCIEKCPIHLAACLIHISLHVSCMKSRTTVSFLHPLLVTFPMGAGLFLQYFQPSSEPLILLTCNILTPTTCYLQSFCLSTLFNSQTN